MKKDKRVRGCRVMGSDSILYRLAWNGRSERENLSRGLKDMSHENIHGRACERGHGQHRSSV